MKKEILWLALLGSLLAISCRERAAADLVSGTIETDEVHLASRYGGRVKRILAVEGQPVVTGQVIVELEAPELAARRDEVQAQLRELQAGPRKEEIAAAKSEWEALVAEWDQAKADAQRADDLFAKNTISIDEHEQVLTRARRLEKSVAASRSRLDLLLAGTRPERIEVAKAQLAEIDTQLCEMKVLARSPGVLETISVKPGDVLAPNREVATLLLTDHLWVRVYVPEPWLGHIKLGEKVRLRVDSHPGKDFSGEVEQIARAAEFTPRNVQTPAERVKQVFGIKIKVQDPEGILKAGMAVDVFFSGIGPK